MHSRDWIIDEEETLKNISDSKQTEKQNFFDRKGEWTRKEGSWSNEKMATRGMKGERNRGRWVHPKCPPAVG